MAGVVLIGDADSWFCRMARHILAEEGHAVLVAGSDQAHSAIGLDGRTAVAIADLDSPDDDWPKTIASLRTAFPSLRVVATAGGGAEDARARLDEAWEAGAALGLAKPYSLLELEGIVVELCRGDRETKEAGEVCRSH